MFFRIAPANNLYSDPEALSMLARTLRDYCQAYKLNPDNNEIRAKLNKLIEKNSKENLFAALLEIAKDDMPLALDMAADAMDKETLLGKKFWLPRGYKACSLNSGTLSYVKAFYDKFSVSYEAANIIFNCSTDKLSYFSVLPKDLNLLVAAATAAASQPDHNPLSFDEAKQIAEASFKSPTLGKQV